MKALYTQHSKLTSQYIDKKLNDFLIEDHADTDLTTRFTLLNKPSIATAKIVVEQKLIFVGTDIIKRIFNGADINILVSEGTRCMPGDVVATIRGTPATDAVTTDICADATIGNFPAGT